MATARVGVNPDVPKDWLAEQRQAAQPAPVPLAPSRRATRARVT
jgi:hypothetical protein